MALEPRPDDDDDDDGGSSDAGDIADAADDDDADDDDDMNGTGSGENFCRLLNPVESSVSSLKIKDDDELPCKTKSLRCQECYSMITLFGGHKERKS